MIYLSRQDVESLNLGMPRIIELLEQMFVEKGRGRVEMPPKPGLHPLPDAFIHAMPAYIPKFSAAGIKWVSGFPQNMEKGLPYIHGLIIMNDVETGIPTAVLDATWVTAMRTGAATAVAAKHLARPESSRVAIIACGVQGRSNLEALACAFKIKEVTAVDTNTKVAERFAADMSKKLNCTVKVSDDIESAVKNVDIVVTSGPILKDPKPPLLAKWIQPGTFISAVDFDSYLEPAVFKMAAKLVTDDLKQMDYYRSVGYFKQTPAAHGDLGQLACGEIKGRQTPEEITVAVNLGIALEDMVVTAELCQMAKRQGLGVTLPL